MGKPLALIVEDEKDISVIFAKALYAAGFETEVAHSGDAAITWLSSNVPNVVVLDLHMPRVAGTDVLQYIRIEPRLVDVNVIIATAYPHMAESLHEAADWVFFKPVSFSQLRDLAARFSTMMPSEKSSGQAETQEVKGE
jgi:two-component system phosphate regulon response regulator PhoB